MKLDPITPEKRLETHAVLAGFCVIMALVKLHHGGSAHAMKLWMEAGVLFLVIGLFIKPLGTLIAQLWLKLSHLLGAIMSRVLISLVFFLVLLPMALLRRACGGKQPVTLARKPAGSSYYTEINKPYTAADLRFPW